MGGYKGPVAGPREEIKKRLALTEPRSTNETMTKFGYPDTLVKDYGAWVVLVRPAQVTLGSLVLVCREPVQAFSALSPQGFEVLGTVVRDTEACLSALWDYDKINYLMLMMVDPDVHFHVIPRYQDARTFEESEFGDKGWPAVPDLGAPHDLPDDKFSHLVAHIAGNWPT